MLEAFLLLALASAPPPPTPILKCSLARERPWSPAPPWEPPGTVVEVVEPSPLPEDPVAESQQTFRAALFQGLALWRPQHRPSPYPGTHLQPALQARHQGNLLPELPPLGWQDWR